MNDCYDPLSMAQNLIATSSDGTWKMLSQVAIKDAEYDSPDRQPHTKCLRGTRVDLLDYIHGLSDNREKRHLIWLHGTAGVGKSAVAFTVADRMRTLKVTDQTNNETRLAGTFFFSRKHAKQCTTGYFFATLAYQLASNFPSIREDVNRAIRENPALLDPNESLHDQMEALFLQPLRKLQFRLRGCPPLVYVVDSLDECTSETKVADLIFLLGRALRDPELPMIHILLTSRSEAHIDEAIQDDDMHPLVCEIPMRGTGEGVAAVVSLDGADVDQIPGDGTILSLDGIDVEQDIYIFLEHSFTQLQHRYSGFPQPSGDQLTRLVRRAGRRFIVASTMIKFIVDDGYKDPRDRLELMLESTCGFLPGTELYKLYDLILSTCTDPKRAYQHLSIVAALADPLPIAQISKLLGSGQGRDVETVLVQLRSIIDIPTDSRLPVNIFHSSVRDYASDPSNCGLPEIQDITPPHSLLAESCLRLMMKDIPIPRRMSLLDALSTLNKQSHAIEPHDPQRLKQSLAFLVQPPEPLQVLIGLLWLRGDRGSNLHFWVETQDGRTWLQTQDGRNWLQTRRGYAWLQTQHGLEWLQTQDGLGWLSTQGGRHWLQTQGWQDWLLTEVGRHWLQTQGGRDWLQDQSGQDWLQDQGGRDWLQIQGGRDWLQTQGGRVWLQTSRGRDWVQTSRGRDWLQTLPGRVWMQTQGGREWMHTHDGQEWLRCRAGREWLQTQSGREWLQTQSAREWMQTWSGREWCQSQPGQSWLQSQVRPTQLHIRARRAWLQTQYAEACWLNQFKDVQLRGEHGWLRSQGGQEWLHTDDGQSWLQTYPDQRHQSTPSAFVWVAMEEFSSTLEVIREYTNISELPPPACQVIQQFKSLPDFLMLPAFLALNYLECSTSAFPQDRFLPDMEIVRAMAAFVTFAKEAREKSRSASNAQKYSYQNWVFHLSRAPNPWDDVLQNIFRAFWDRHLLSWLEAQWCLKGLQSCLVILSEGQKIAKAHLKASM